MTPLELYNLRNTKPEMTDSDFVQWAKTPIVANTRSSVDREAFNQYLAAKGWFARLEAAKSNPNTFAVAATALGYLSSSKADSVVKDNGVLSVLLGSMVMSGICTQEEADLAISELFDVIVAPDSEASIEKLALGKSAFHIERLRAENENVKAKFLALYSGRNYMLDKWEKEGTIVSENTQLDDADRR